MSVRCRFAGPIGYRHGLPVCLIALAAVLPFGTASGAINMVVPPGFQNHVEIEQVGVGLTQIAWTPDGQLLLGGKAGQIMTWDGQNLTLIRNLPVATVGESGVNGLAVDPDWETNQYLWIYYRTQAPERNRLSRFTYTGTDLIDEWVVIEGPEPNNANHNAGGTEFAPDGTIFVAMGDDKQGAPTSQNLFDLRGKILHINRDGTPAADNPFRDGVGGNPLVWAYGLRNPYRISVQPGTGNLFVGDVGWFIWEELDLPYAGANLGWPDTEGPSPEALAGVVYPIHSYNHNGAGACIVGGAFAEPGDFAPQYEGDYFFADHITGEVFRMTLDDTNSPASVEVFATAADQLVDLEFGPEGNLWYLSFVGLKTLGYISYENATNDQPVAVVTASADSGAAPLSVSFDGDSSYDPDDDTLTHLWDFGDGNTDPSSTVIHSYAAGVYTAKLTVDDGNGGSDMSESIRVVSGNARPVPSLGSPSVGSAYNAGDTIAYSGSGSDAEEGSTPCAQHTWQVYRRTTGQVFPVQGPLQGSCSGSFTIADRGEMSVDTSYEIVQRVRDTGVPIGPDAVLEGKTSVTIVPNVSTMTFETQPLTDLSLTLDGEPFGAPMSVPGVVNFKRDLGAVDDQIRGPHTFVWLSWSDGGEIDHEIATPAVDTSFVATFGCDVLVEAEELRIGKGAGDQILLTWSAVSDICLAPDEERYRIYAAPAASPTTEPGSFPGDPAFTMVGKSSTESFGYVPGPDDSFFLIVPTGTDLQEGPVGHYGF